MKKLTMILAAGAFAAAMAAPAPAVAGQAERQIIAQCAYAGVQNEAQMQHCTGGLYVPKHVLDSCMAGGPCFDPPQGRRFADTSSPVWQPNDYQRDAMTCYASTGELITGSLCAAGAVSARTFSKCANGIGVRGGCFGPSNTLRQVIEDPREAGRNFDRGLREKRKRVFGF